MFAQQWLNAGPRRMDCCCYLCTALCKFDSINAVSMLDNRLQRWLKTEPALCQSLSLYCRSCNYSRPTLQLSIIYNSYCLKWLTVTYRCRCCLGSESTCNFRGWLVEKFMINRTLSHVFILDLLCVRLFFLLNSSCTLFVIVSLFTVDTYVL